MIALEQFEGLWQLTREIEDRRGGVTGRLEGTCRWLRDAQGLRQEEEGLLAMGKGPALQARRVYLWRAAGDGIEVTFEDGRPFHRLGPGRLTDRHLCDPDTYDVSYDVAQWPDWTQRWRVTGPRKDAVILSRFRPLRPPLS